jgi:hypothetical protein
MRNYSAIAFAAAALALASCSSFPAGEAWNAEGEALPGGLSVEIGADGSDFRIRGGALEGAALRGRAERDGEAWKLRIDRMEWFGNWNEGWTEASFGAEGELSLVPSGEGWAVAVERAPAIGQPEKATIRLYGNYFDGDEALGLLSRRWERIKAAADFVKERFPEAGPGAKRYGRAVRAFLFPELYGYAKAGAPLPAKGHGVKVGESVRWDSDYSASVFPEELRELRDSGTMLRDFEEGLGLWSLRQRWDRIWSEEIIVARFAAANKK